LVIGVEIEGMDTVFAIGVPEASLKGLSRMIKYVERVFSAGKMVTLTQVSISLLKLVTA
jgi:hypothetical protein